MLGDEAVLGDACGVDAAYELGVRRENAALVDLHGVLKASDSFLRLVSKDPKAMYLGWRSSLASSDVPPPRRHASGNIDEGF